MSLEISVTESSFPENETVINSHKYIFLNDTKEIPPFPHTLEALYLHECTNITCLPELPQSLKSITILDCPELKHICPPFEKGTRGPRALPLCLEKLTCTNCPKLEMFHYSDLPFPQTLKSLCLWSCPKLENLLPLPEGLERVSCVACPQIQIPVFPKSVKEIDWRGY